jgi:hypothetical protein
VLAAAASIMALAVIFCATGVAWACPGCKDALAANGAGTARGFYWSILFMLCMPYAILGTVGGYFYLEVRRARADKARLAERQAAQAKVDNDSTAAPDEPAK